MEKQLRMVFTYSFPMKVIGFVVSHPSRKKQKRGEGGAPSSTTPVQSRKRALGNAERPERPWYACFI
jgi:hypothetical protein